MFPLWLQELRISSGRLISMCILYFSGDQEDKISMKGKKYLSLFYCRVDCSTYEVQDEILLWMKMFPTDVCFLSLSTASLTDGEEFYDQETQTVTACVVWYKFSFSATRSRCYSFPSGLIKKYALNLQFFVWDATRVLLSLSCKSCISWNEMESNWLASILFLLHFVEEVRMTVTNREKSSSLVS